MKIGMRLTEEHKRKIREGTIKALANLSLDAKRRRLEGSKKSGEINRKRLLGSHRKTIEQKFQEKIVKGNPDECWFWIGAKKKARQNEINGGYGILVLSSNPRKVIPAHRLSWQIHNGPIPHGLHVLHHCDNPPCVNPSHLYLGTPQDNTNDMMTRNRWHPMVGDAHPRGFLGKHHSQETRKRIGENTKRIRATRFWSSLKKNIQTTEVSATE